MLQLSQCGLLNPGSVAGNMIHVKKRIHCMGKKGAAHDTHRKDVHDPVHHRYDDGQERVRLSQHVTLTIPQRILIEIVDVN